MLEVIIAYDDNDDVLGDYFEESYKNVIEGINFDNISLTSIRGLDCTEKFIIASIPKNNQPYVFIGLSHGKKGKLETNNNVFVDAKNVSHFNNSIFYSPACSSAILLGQELIRAGCLSFVGFKINSSASTEEFYSIFYSCENYCIKEFLKGEKTIGETFDEMLQYFDKQINDLVNCNEIIVAQDLLDNKEGFVLYGNESLRMVDVKI